MGGHHDSVRNYVDDGDQQMTHPVVTDRRLSPFWVDEQSFATTLLVMFIEAYGTKEQELNEVLNWDPITIQMEVEQDFGVDLPIGNYERLMTAISLLTTNTFFSSPPDFTRACVVLSGHTPYRDLMILPDAADIAWGVTEGLLINPPDEKDENPFISEITAFIGQVLDSEGIINPPDILRIATRDRSLLERVNYDFSDDPEMFSAINKMEADKSDSINFVIKGRLRALLSQLSKLPLHHGNTEKVVGQLLQRMQGSEYLPLIA